MMFADSRKNLALGIAWLALWAYKGLWISLRAGQVLEGLLEILVTFPLGIGWASDFFLYGRHGRGPTLEQKAWTFPDRMFFLTGAAGVLTILLSPLRRGKEALDLVVFGLVAATLGLAHYLRRKLRMGQ